jgi:hypothetical protein
MSLSWIDFNAGSRTGGRNPFLCAAKEKDSKERLPDAAYFLRVLFSPGAYRRHILVPR